MHDYHEIHGRIYIYIYIYIYIHRSVQKGKAASIGRWVGRGAKSAKKKYKITVLRNKVGVFLGKFVVH